MHSQAPGHKGSRARVSGCSGCRVAGVHLYTRAQPRDAPWVVGDDLDAPWLMSGQVTATDSHMEG